MMINNARICKCFSTSHMHTWGILGGGPVLMERGHAILREIDATVKCTHSSFSSTGFGGGAESLR